jgi:hypothetical protein
VGGEIAKLGQKIANQPQEQTIKSKDSRAVVLSRLPARNFEAL